MQLSQKENIFLIKIPFLEWSGHAVGSLAQQSLIGRTILVIGVSEDIVTCQGLGQPVLCVQCQVSIILSQECKLFQSSVLTMFNGKVSCLVESDGRVQY